MLSGKIERVWLALAELAGVVEPGQWEFIADCRRMLEEARRTAAMVETGLAVPRPGRYRKDGEVVQ